MIQFSGNRHPFWSLEGRSTWCFLLFTPDSLDRTLKFSHNRPVDKGRHASRLGASAVCSLGLLRSRDDGSQQRHSWVLNQGCLDVKTFPDKQKQPSHQIPPWPLWSRGHSVWNGQCCQDRGAILNGSDSKEEKVWWRWDYGHPSDLDKLIHRVDLSFLSSTTLSLSSLLLSPPASFSHSPPLPFLTFLPPSFISCLEHSSSVVYIAEINWLIVSFSLCFVAGSVSPELNA